LMIPDTCIFLSIKSMRTTRCWNWKWLGVSTAFVDGHSLSEPRISNTKLSTVWLNFDLRIDLSMLVSLITPHSLPILIKIYSVVLIDLMLKNISGMMNSLWFRTSLRRNVRSNSLCLSSSFWVGWTECSSKKVLQLHSSLCYWYCWRISSIDNHSFLSY
jgi:hypothetical protein